MPSFHVDSIQHWEPFTHDGVSYDLGHLDCHEVVFQKQGDPIRFVVTYGLHCFTKDGTSHNIPMNLAAYGCKLVRARFRTMLPGLNIFFIPARLPPELSRPF